jgi:hypothetical protein
MTREKHDLLHLEREGENAMLLFISDVWLDKPKVRLDNICFEALFECISDRIVTRETSH